ncbi:MAG: hypothetical protein KF809_03665 [Chloroflexi bacterium]|nr:hypothetical protein [Chloroflexota bacterium]
MRRWTTRLTLAAGLCLTVTTGTVAQGDLPASLGANTPAFQDDLTTPGAWGLPDANGSTTDTDGALRMDFTSEGWMWGWRSLTASHHPVVRVEGTVAIDGDAAGGWMCGTASGIFAFGIVDDADGWQIGHIIERQVTIDQSGSLSSRLAAEDGEPRLVSVECGRENVDISRVLLRVNGRSVGSANVGPIGPFGRVAFVGRGDASDASITFDDISAWTGARYTPSDDAPSSPGPAPTTPDVDSVLGADTLAFTDDFSTPDLWGTGATAQGFVSYADEQLAISILSEGASRWSWRSVDAATPVLRIEGSVRLTGSGSAGWMCGDDSQDGPLLFGTMGASGDWTVGRVAGGEITVIERGDVPAGAPGTEPRHVTLECGDTSDGTTRLVLWVGDDQVADVTLDDQQGPFRRAVAMARSASDSVFNARFDDVTVRVGGDPAPSAE